MLKEGSIMFKDLVKANRTVRGFDRSRKVKIGELREMIDCARLSASSVNMQPLKYYIANSKEEAEKLNELTKLGAMLPELHLPFKGTEPPAYILICQDLDISDHETMFLKDVGIAAQSMSLAATEMGLSCCMIGNFSNVKLHEALDLPANCRVQLVLAVGKAAEEVRLTEMKEGDRTEYYRDENGTHFVPKRRLEDIIIGK